MNIKIRAKGFTVVELAVVISVIGILATVTTVAYGNWRDGLAEDQVKSDLLQVAASMNTAKNFNNGYPSSIPTSFKPTPDVVLDMTTTSSGSYCINGFHARFPAIRMSIRSGSDSTPKNSLCSGGSSGSTVGGTVPSAPKGSNIAPSFEDWTFSGTASYNSTSKEFVMGSSGSATSPLVRANGVNAIDINGQFSANVQSAHVNAQPDGAWHSSIYYYASNGTTPVTNTANYTGNGCARTVQLGGGWNPSKNGACAFSLGPNVVYFKVILHGPQSGYTSTDLKIKDMTFILR